MKYDRAVASQFGRVPKERRIQAFFQKFVKCSTGCTLLLGSCNHLLWQRPSSRWSNAIKSKEERGASKTAIVFLLTVVGLLVHVGFKLFPIYYSYFELHNQMGSLIRVADELKDSEIRKRIEEQLKSLKIPADISDVRIERRAQTMLLSLDYIEILTLGFGDYKFDVWRFNFLCEVEDVIPQG
jgi:hypothetical protein